MANRFLNNIKINDSYTLPAADGTADQVITTDGSGQLSFVDQSTLAVDSAEVVEVPVKNLQGSALTKGDPVYISGSVGSSGRLEVQLADAGNTAKMPAVGLLKQDLAINGEGYVVVTGKLRNLATSPIDGATPSEGDVIYVKSGGSTGAALTTTKPTGANLIQNMGKVGRVSTSSDGTFVVSSILRANDVPTPLYVDHPNQRLGIGISNPTTTLDVYGTVNIGTTGSMGIQQSPFTTSIFYMQAGTGSTITFGAPTSYQQNVSVQGDLFVTSGSTSSYIGTKRFGSWNNRLDYNGDNYLNSGNLGIGTTNPVTRTHVYGPNHTGAFNTGALMIQQSSDNSRMFIDGNDIDAADGILFLQDYSQNPVRLGDDLQMPNGSIGVGFTSAPAAKVHASDGATVPSIDAGTMFLASNTSGAGDYSSMSIISGTAGIASLFLGDTDAEKRGSVRYLNSTDEMRFRTANTDRVTIKSGGNVGIGTTSANSRLEVSSTGANGIVISQDTGTTSNSGRLFFQTDTSSEGVALMNSNGIFQIRTGAAANSTSGTPRVSVANNGAVGIGTNNPIGNLEINTATVRTSVNGGADELVIQNDGYSGISIISSATTAGQIHFGDVNQSNTGMIQYFHSDNSMRFATGDALEKMRIDSSGNVGIGTTSPAAGIQVATNGLQDYHAWFGAAGFVNNSAYHYDFAKVGFSVDDPDGADTGAGFSFTTRNSGDNNWMHGYIYQPQDGGIAFGTGGAGTTSASERMRIDSSGNVGIGTTNPLDVLHVEGTIRAVSPAASDWGLLAQNNVGAASSGIWFNSGDGELLLRDDADNLNVRLRSDTDSYINGGSLGIGTTSPARRLHVDSGATNEVARFSSTDGTAYISIMDNATSNSLQGIGSVGDELTFYANNSERMRIDDSGRVGIGKSPQSGFILDANGAAVIRGSVYTSGDITKFNSGALTIRNSVSGQPITFATENTSERMRITSAGNVGIGTTNPGSDLHISDNFPRITLQDTDGTNTLSFIDHDGSYLNLISRNGSNHGNIRFRRYDGTTTENSMIINHLGKVGVNSDNPHGLLTSHQGQQTGNAFTNPNLALTSSTATDGGFIGMTFAASTAINYGYSVGAHRTSLAHSDFEINYHHNDAAGTTRFMIDQTGDVGIGTTSPAGKLHSESAAATSEYTILAKSTGVNNWSGLYHHSSDNRFSLDLRNGSGTQTVTINSNGNSYLNGGNVGVGTTNPSAKLDIVQTAVNAGIIIRSSVTQPEISFIDDSTGDSFSIGHNRAGNRMDIEINGTDVHTFTEGGNVGIGTLSPGRRLAVSSSGVIADFNSSTTSSYIDIEGTTAQLRAGVFGGVVGLANGTGTSAHLALSSSGNVGIGTTSPGYKLDVKSSGTSTYVAHFTSSDGASLGGMYEDASTNGEFYVKNSTGGTNVLLNSSGTSYLNGGNVGIGTTSPAHALDVSGTIATDSSFLAVATQPSLTFIDSNGGGSVYTSAGSMYFKTGVGTPTVKMTILSGGNVGIGTTSPGSKLHVEGSGVAIANGSNTKTTLIPSGGGNSELTLKGQNFIHYVNYETSWNNFRYARLKSSYSTSDSEFYLYKSNGTGGTAATTTISTGTSKFAGSIGVNTTSVRSTLDVNGPLSVVGGTFTSGATGADSNANSAIVVRRGKRILSGIPGVGEDYYLRNLIWQTSSNNIEVGQLGTSLIGDISLQAGSSGNIKFFGSGSEDMRVNSSGNVCIGNTNNTYALDVTGTIRATGDVIAYSDIRVKENIKTIDNALDKVKALRGVEYNKIDNSEKSIGVIAQEIEEIIPQVVKEDEAGMKSVAYGNITAVLIEAIKEQQKQIDQLKAIIDGST